MIGGQSFHGLNRIAANITVESELEFRPMFRHLESMLWGSVSFALSALGRTKLLGLRLFRIVRAGDALGMRKVEMFPSEIELRASNTPDGALTGARMYPAIGFHLFEGAAVTLNPRLSSVFHRDTMILPEAASTGPWKIAYKPESAGVVHEKNGKVLVRSLGPQDRLQSAIYVGSWSPHNWFHWLVDTLPSVYFARMLPEEFRDVPVLIPETALNKRSWIEPLRLVLGERRVRPLPINQFLYAERLVWMTSPTSPGPAQGLPARSPNFSMHGSAMNLFTRHLLRELAIDGQQSEPGNRVFLARGDGANRPYNEAELIELSRDFGFRPVFLADMNFRDSVHVLATAEAVIGPHGAGWANAMFSPPQTPGLMWTWESARYDNWFANIGALANMDFTVRFTPGSPTSAYDVPPELFVTWVEEILSPNSV